MTKLYLFCLAIGLVAGCASKPTSKPVSQGTDQPTKKSSTTCADINLKIKQTYDFLPNEIGEPQRSKKLKQVAAFWSFVNEVNAEEPKFVSDCLASALKDNKANGYFLYDGAKLLLTLSKEQKDTKVAVEAYIRADLRQVDLANYVQTINSFSCKGFDTSRAAEALLKMGDFGSVHLSRVKLDKTLAVYFILAPLEEKYYKDKILTWLNDNNISQMATITNGLYMFDKDVLAVITQIAKGKTMTADLRKKIRFYAGQPELDRSKKLKMTREKFDEILARSLRAGALVATKDELNDMLLLVTGQDFAKLKELKRKLMCRVSDDAIFENKLMLSLLQIASYASR